MRQQAAYILPLTTPNTIIEDWVLGCLPSFPMSGRRLLRNRLRQVCLRQSNLRESTLTPKNLTCAGTRIRRMRLMLARPTFGQSERTMHDILAPKWQVQRCTARAHASLDEVLPTAWLSRHPSRSRADVLVHKAPGHADFDSNAAALVPGNQMFPLCPSPARVELQKPEETRATDVKEAKICTTCCISITRLRAVAGTR